MGAADVVPGVSGGTIAFISNIYEELLTSISNVGDGGLKLLLKGKFVDFWKHVNGNFLLALVAGIGISILSLAKLIGYLLDAHPIYVWSFFFGLVTASIFFVGKQVVKWKVDRVIGFMIGTLIAYSITVLPAQPDHSELWYVFLSGAIAICAMILPGISGSFILLLMGSYRMILASISDKNFVVIATFGTGALIGLLSFSRVLKWMFAKYHDITIALLSGFLLGSLNKVWPWKEVLETYTKHPGTPEEMVVPIVERSISPFRFEEIMGDSHLTTAILLAILGMVLIFGLERIASLKKVE